MEHHDSVPLRECEAIVRELAEAAMAMRGTPVSAIAVKGIEARTETLGVWASAFAAVVLLP